MLLPLPLLITSEHPLFEDVRCHLRANAPGRHFIAIGPHRCAIYFKNSGDREQFACTWSVLVQVTDARVGMS